MIKQFEVGKLYQMRSICDRNTRWQYQVMKRTAKSVWLACNDDLQMFRVTVWRDVETCRPLGSYSMAPILAADKAAN